MSASEQRLNIYEIDINGTQALGFDSGLDARSFAQARLAQFLAEPGYVIHPSGSITQWRASGVVEAVNPSAPGSEPTMHVWGPAFTGTRLDILLNDPERQGEALPAIVRWIDAFLALEAQGNASPALWPCAALIAGNAAAPGTVLIVPQNLARRCIQAEGEGARLRGIEMYVHPDLEGTDGAVYTAAALLYQVFAGNAAFTAPSEETLRQDMREGNFLPMRLAALGLDSGIASPIQEALELGQNSSRNKNSSGTPLRNGSSSMHQRQSSTALLRRIRECLGAAPEKWKTETFFTGLSPEEKEKLREEKEKHLHRKKIAVHTRRFIIRNTAIISGIAIAVLITLFVGISIARSKAAAPNTVGLDSLTVVQSYYEAISAMDHQLMEAYTNRNAGKNDINMVTNLFVITRVRQAYEYGQFQFIPPAQWLQAGKPDLDLPIFGITDLHITHISGAEDSDDIMYTAVYTLWVPISETQEKGPDPYARIDQLRLTRIRGNWRITEILRTEQGTD